MKHGLTAALLFFFAVLIAVAVFLIIQFFSILDSSQPDAAETPVQSSDAQPAEEASQNARIVEYTKEHWQDYNVSYDPAANELTLSKETAMDHEAACAYGGSVYEGKSAPETYLQTVQIIAIDVSAHCDSPGLSATLCYLSSDGKPIFTVSSGGEIWTCWESEDP